jgi:hypothetical protein
MPVPEYTWWARAWSGFPSGDGVRPIAIGETFYKLAALHAITSVSSILADILQPIQFGVGIPGGTEIAASLLQSLLTDTGAHSAGLACDFRNAFNEVDRAHILKSLSGAPPRSDLAHRPLGLPVPSPLGVAACRRSSAPVSPRIQPVH